MASPVKDFCPSDTDLSTGLPSPNGSDDEDFKQSQDLGIAVPNYCNKLRTMTQHLFSKPEAVVLSDLCAQGISKEKNEPRVRSNVRDGADVPRRSVHSHSGYASSPRWNTKSPSLRPYDPCDITGNDELEVAGVLFRSWTPGKDEQQTYSKTDSDFPSLNESSLNDRSELTKSNDTSLGLSNLSSENPTSKAPKSPAVVKTGLMSPVTSTPTQNKFRQDATQESPLPRHQQSPLCGNTSSNKPEPKSHSRSGSKGNRRRSKKLSISQLDADSQSHSLQFSPKTDVNANNNIIHHASPTVVPHKKPDAWGNRQKQQMLDIGGNFKNSSLPSQTSQPANIAAEASADNKPASPSWSNIVKTTSPLLSPIMRMDSPRNYLQDFPNPSLGEKPKPVEIIRKANDVRSHGIEFSSQSGASLSGGNKSKEKTQRVQLMSVDCSSVTPKKKADAEMWPSNSNTSSVAFENRFVEKIAVSGTSPPKKVNPSPIKKLDFSHRSIDYTPATDGERENRDHTRKASLFKRQVSLISDLDWKRDSASEPPNPNKDNRGNMNMRGNRNGGRERSGRGRRAMFSLEDYVKTQDASKPKDRLPEDEVEEKDFVSEETKAKVGEFWVAKSPAEEMAACKSGAQSVKEGPQRVPARSTASPEAEHLHKDVVADPQLVTRKTLLRRHARVYCYYFEGHHVTNVSKELLFIAQLLTCSQSESLSLTHLGNTIFDSVHNCVYFAVLVMRRLNRLFACLPKPTLSLLAINVRIQAFSPKLHNLFKALVTPEETCERKEGIITGGPSESNAIASSQNWSSTFSNIKMVHVFKCQRDNFFALYHRYQNATVEKPFQMEEQIHFVYDPHISEHNSVVNLMHLAQLFLDHLLKSSMQQADDQVNYFEMFINSKTDTDGFQKQFEKWKEFNSALKLGSPPKWTKNEVFFKDFLRAIRCPAFNEIMKNMIASKILELNGSDFTSLKNLHSSVCLPEDQTPQRCERFTTTVRQLCILAKFMSYLVFNPYSGSEDLSPEENSYMYTVREMMPLPLPLPMLLKAACERGHLGLTVPWLVQYLSMMDAAACKLTAYSHIINQLCAIHRHSWNNLYDKGHDITGLLITSCISWLFENPVFPTGLLYSKPENAICIHSGPKCLDTQRVVTSRLLYLCCPYLNGGHVPLVTFALQQKTASCIRNVMPLTPSSSQPESCAASATTTVTTTSSTATNTPHQEGDKEVDELCQWLGVSLNTHSVDDDKSENRDDQKPDEEEEEAEGNPKIVPSICSRFVNGAYSMGILTTDLLQCHAYLSHSIHQAVDMMCGKVQDYTARTLLKLAVFEAKVKVRRKFLTMDAGQDANSTKSQIMANSTIMAAKISHSIKKAFFQTGERVCQTELPNLIQFLTSHKEESIRISAVAVSQKAAMSRLLEWSQIQLGTDIFRKVIITETEKLASVWGFKSCNLYPSDYMRKPEYNSSNTCPVLDAEGLEHLQQVSKVLDTALACGSWYMNGQTRGPRPDDAFIKGLMEDFMACIKNHNICMDFSFNTCINFIMHLIIQYIADAPYNWTDECLETFINTCILFETKKTEDDRISFQPVESSHKARRMEMRVTNLISVYSLEWLSRSPALDLSLMVYCGTIVKLVSAGLVSVEKIIDGLTATRKSHHFNTATQLMLDRITVKVLDLLYTSKCQASGCSVERVVSLSHKTLKNLTDCSSERALAELQTMLSDDGGGKLDST